MAGTDIITHQDFQSVLPKIQKSVGSLYDTLDNLLLWSRAQMNGFKTVPRQIALPAFINDITALFNEMATNKKISIQSDIPANATVFMDEEQLKIVTRNLVNNALKFTNENLEIYIHLNIRNPKIRYMMRKRREMVYLIKATMMLGNSIIDAYIIWFIKLIQSRFRGELC